MTTSDAETGSKVTGPKVLEFYKELPFNYRETTKEHVKTIKRQNSVNAYPVLQELLEKKKTTVLEVGCGVGWLSNALAHHHKCLVTGLDFNPVAIERAKDISQSLKTNINFQVGNLFEFSPEAPVDLVVSLGVLHHTGDCTGAVRRVCQEFVKPGGHVFIGLYHSYGRQPFLNHFKKMQDDGASEDDMLNCFRDLDPRFKDDETHLRSWFRDQVL
ncbi:MAG: class I SAM-dependent methyltransferase, partial [Rhodospirillales bacterium]